MIRFDAHDAELEQWLGGFAQSQSMTKVVKLACYLLAGLEPPPHLQALLPYVQPPRAPSARRVAPPYGREVPGDALARVMQELAALRALMAEQGAGRPHAERTRARRQTTPDWSNPAAGYERPAPTWPRTPGQEGAGSSRRLTRSRWMGPATRKP